MRSRSHDALPLRDPVAMDSGFSKLSLLAVGIAAGALTVFFFDSVSGGRRRAFVRDKIVGASHDAASFAQATSKRAADRASGLFATGRLDRVTRSEPQSDQQLHDRIRARLGRVISHPRSVHVEVRGSSVCLTGHILTRELDDLLSEVKHSAGARTVENQLTCHDSAEGIPELQGRTEPRGREQRRDLVS